MTTLAPPGEPRRVAYLYLLPGLVVFGLFVLAPLLHSAWLSLFTWDGVTPGTWNGLGNYSAIVSDPKIRSAFLHALMLVASTRSGRSRSGCCWRRRCRARACAGWRCSGPCCSCRR